MNTAKKIDVYPVKPRILLIEDELMVQKIHRILLEQIGYEVDTASNGAEALQKLSKKSKYSLIFADVGLPDISGIQIIKAIRENEKNGEHVPIIVLTAYQDDVIKAQCLDAGADCVRGKPISEENLAEIITQYDQASLLA
ncbi:MAG TPA: response regulator [Gammaproteobacteria bacterium]|jgi:CheY-like chemotaxis protein|nr:response regulator [Gammaproteobacteria bacterium]